MTYTYDALGQLTKAAGSTTYNYTYDTVGNILTGNGHSYTYGDTGGWKDLLTKVDGHSISYDSIGNPTTYYNGTSWTFTWAEGRRLATASGGGNSISYTYDADGLRTSKTVNGAKHTYYYAGGKLLRETYGSNTLDFFYDANGHAYALKHNDTIYYYITNLQGDVMSIVDGSGTVKAEYNYDPYGNVLTATGTMAEVNPIRYRGYYYDAETGLYYVSSRYYDPEIGRFINADAFASTGQGIIGNNMFAYCGNNPVTRTDIGGYFWDTVFDVVSLCFSIVDVASNPTDVTAWIGLAGDAIDLIPFVSGVGELTRAATTTLEVIDSVHDTSRMIDNTGDIIDTAGDVARKTDFYVTPNGEAIPATLDGFNNNLSKLDNRNGKYVGADSNGPIRIRPNEIHPENPNFTGIASQHHTIPHFHIDRRINGNTGDWVSTYVGAMEMLF